ncbi:ArsR/SmtB family transcription factor [Solicola gregarius]|uniref:Winged helix-turn-helix domain-containing protein n=1 Tax=Solicola gregarius TaxID=2908642 RepID=A0AA46YKR3_9ACTN|nr:winged helix-turn-helix domain-containing protein [Solicola gregarius]UYM06045.1 winged helix-turn-helix domain-containing protein [Solicola gregarius]
MSLEVSSLRALAHPVRLQILSLLTGSAMSATELAGELDISQANASYHLRALASAGYVVVDSEERIRGGVAKRYRHPWDSAQPSRPAHDEDYLLYVQAMARELVRRAAYRDPDYPARSNTDAELWVTPEVWEEVFDLVERASTMLHSSARRPRTPGAVHVNMTASLFAMRERKVVDGR